jgi:hypothetical protein
VGRRSTELRVQSTERSPAEYQFDGNMKTSLKAAAKEIWYNRFKPDGAVHLEPLSAAREIPRR